MVPKFSGLEHTQLAANRLLSMLENKEENLDTINKYFSDLRIDVLFQYNAGAYGSIKSGGIDKISNDSIRAKMAVIYEFFIPQTEKTLEKLSDSDPVENALVEKSDPANNFNPSQWRKSHPRKNYRYKSYLQGGIPTPCSAP